MTSRLQWHCFAFQRSYSHDRYTPLQLALQQQLRLQLVRRTLHTTSHVFLDMLISRPAFSVGVQEYWFSLVGTLLAVVPARGMAWLLVVVAAAWHLLCSCVYPN